MYYIEIDITKKCLEVSFLNENGYILDANSFSIPNTASGLVKLQDKLNKFELTSDNSLNGKEANSHYWLVLYSWLIEYDFNVKYINTIITDAYHNLFIRKTKNERIDTEVVARVLKMGEYQEI